MIGLGSNRLSVCRRGGMSVTQAGRGGMEWLGVRYPLWATPYSAQATAALKAAFTAAQWVTIRDYGFAHPALVPFINEDQMLVCSLIPELGKERWIHNNGVAFILTDIMLNENSRIVSEYKVDRSTGSVGSLFGSEITWSNNMFFYTWSAGQNYICYKSSFRQVSETATSTDICKIDANKNVWLVQNLTKGTTINSNTFSVSAINAGVGVGLFICQTPSTTGSKTSVDYQYSAKYFDIYADGTLTHQFVPCKHIDNGVLKCGMLDLVDLRWYGDSNQATGVATFTISETPAS